MEIELFKDLDGKRLVQTVSHAFILSIFNHFGNVSLWLKRHVSLLFFVKKKVQILHHLLPSGNNYSQNYQKHILKRWKNMLTCRSVWGFECLVSILSFKFFIRFSLHQKMNHNYFLYLRCFVGVSFVLLGVPDHGAVPNHGPVQGAVCTKQMMVLYHTCDTWCFWTKSWCWTSSRYGTSLWIPSLSLRPSKKFLKTYTKKSRETFKNQRTTKRSISRKSGPRYVTSKSCGK